ncbi:hypothetical protein NFI96_024740, partial [Prochilodus magdalenae]
MHSSNHIKFADETPIVGLISKNDESAYREEVQRLTDWCRTNNLSLNVDKTKEMVVDFRRTRRDHSPLHIDGSTVEIVKTTKFLGAHLPPPILTTFYRGAIESILSSCITAWFWNGIVSDRKSLHRVVRTAEKIIGVSLPTIADIYTTRCIRKATSIVDDHTHTLHPPPVWKKDYLQMTQASQAENVPAQRSPREKQMADAAEKARFYRCYQVAWFKSVMGIASGSRIRDIFNLKETQMSSFDKPGAYFERCTPESCLQGCT